MRGAEITRRVREEKLTRISKELFEIGPLEAGPLDPSYVRRLNTVMAQRRQDMQSDVPATLADAINHHGNIRKHAELVVLGNWLVDGSPGAKPRPGRQPDTKKVLNCVAAIIAAIAQTPLKRKHVIAECGRESRKRAITKHALADQWKHLFGEKVEPSNFDASVRSSRHILLAYLEYLKSGSGLLPVPWTRG